jgi:hypothetical protein
MPARRSKCRKCRISWYNPPFCKSVKDNIAKEFFCLIGRFRRNTVNASYHTMPNMAHILAKHNTKVMNREQAQETTDQGYSCTAANPCPLQGRCKTAGVV